MFDSFPTYARYRTLGLADPMLRGEDVYALQTALAAAGKDVGALDGILGSHTASAIRAVQGDLHLVVDGLAGGKTQQGLALRFAARTGARYALPEGLLRGQLEHESGFRLGNYSARRADGSFDAGVAQRNTAHTPAKDGFSVGGSIDALGARVRDHFDRFAGVPTVKRRWQLAQGAWNAPAFACYIARESGATAVSKSMTAAPSGLARRTFEAYIASVSAYLVV